MRGKLLTSLLFSVEWRLYAFVITSLFLWATTGKLAFAAAQALGLQVFLLAGHSLWYYFRQDARSYTLESLVRKVIRVFYRGF